MRFHLALTLFAGGGAALAASCSNDNASHAPYTSTAAAGGKAGRGGRGSGGSKAHAGQGGSDAGAAGAGQGGEGATNESGGTGTLGAGGVPYTGDIGAEAGTGGGGGEPGPGDAEGRLFIGPGGYDAASGTRDDPFGTLAGAAAVATRGHTIVFLPGNYTFPQLDDAIVIPDGVDVAADEPRLVALVASSGDTLLDLAGDTHIDGLRFSGFVTVARAESDHGNVTITNSSFMACPSDSGQGALEVGGGATLALTADSLHDWGDCPAFAHVGASGKLSFDGGLLHFSGSAEPGVFSAEGEGTLELSNLTATDGDRPLIALAGHASATVTQSTFTTLADHVAVLDDQASLAATNADLSLAAAASSPDSCIQSNGTATDTLALTHSLLHGCRTAIGGSTPTTLTLDDTDMYGMTESGIDLASSNGSHVTITGCSFHDEGMRAARFGGGSPGVFHLTLRDSSVTSVPDGFVLDGATGSSWDLGTLADPGQNTLSATNSSLVLANTSVTFVTAVGNTWAADVQGADANGHYTAGGGSTLEVTSGSGQNYTDDYGGTLRLAESP